MKVTLHHVWTIFENPSDFPGKFVVRRFFIYRGKVVADNHQQVCDSLDEARAKVPNGYVNVGRDPNDDATIVESYL